MALQKVVIAGGGIVGNSIAYFLAKRNVPVTLVDAVGIAPGASSKAGGFLARDWRDDTELEQIQRLGFELHQELANELGSSVIDYRRLTVAAVSIDETRAVQKPPSKKVKDLEWVDRGVIGSVPLGDEDSIAQGKYFNFERMHNLLFELSIHHFLPYLSRSNELQSAS